MTILNWLLKNLLCRFTEDSGRPCIQHFNQIFSNVCNFYVFEPNNLIFGIQPSIRKVFEKKIKIGSVWPTYHVGVLQERGSYKSPLGPDHQKEQAENRLKCATSAETVVNGPVLVWNNQTLQTAIQQVLQKKLQTYPHVLPTRQSGFDLAGVRRIEEMMGK